MKVLGLDVETTGLDTNKDVIIELGGVLFDVNEGTWEPLQAFSALVHEPGYPELTDEIKDLTGIKSYEGAGPFMVAIIGLQELADQAALVVAHNAAFDRAMLRSNLERHGLQETVFHRTPWVCSIAHLPAVQKFRCKTLSHLALDAGIPVDPRDLHRTDADVSLMGKLLTMLKADPQAMLAESKRVEIVIHAQTPHPRYDRGVGVAHAKACGFSWKKIWGLDEEFDGLWVKKIKEDQLETERQKCPFPIHVVRSLPCFN